MINFSKLSEATVLYPQISFDNRGYFFESFRQDEDDECRFVQDNHSRSKRFVLRGLHYQVNHVQGKLVRVVKGEIFDVAVDLRWGNSFGSWKGTYLSENNQHQMWIPPGFAHGFYVLTDAADVLYKTTDYYHPEDERTLLWNDDTINVDWPLYNAIPVLSDKDKLGKCLAELEVFE